MPQTIGNLSADLRRRAEYQSKASIASGAVAVVTGAVAGFAVMLSSGSTLAGVGAAIGASLAVGTLISAEVGVYAVLAVAFIDGLLKGMGSGWYIVLAKDVFLLLTILRWLWDGAIGIHRMRSLGSRVALPAFLFVLYCGAEMFNTTTVSFSVALAGFRTWVIWIPLLFIAQDTFRRPAQVRRLIAVVAVLAGLTAAYGIVQFQIGFGHLQHLGPGFGFYALRFGGGAHIRATSTLVAPGVFGASAQMGALICLGGVGFLQRPQWARTALALTCALAVVGMATSGSRAPLIALIVALAAFVCLVRVPRLFLVMAVVGILIVQAANFFQPEALTYRLQGEQLSRKTVVQRAVEPFMYAWKVVADHPFGKGVATGMGIGRGFSLMGEDVQIDPEAAGIIENEYGRALRELGFPGALLFVFLLYRVVGSAGRARARLQYARDRWLAGSLIAVLVSGIVLLSVGSALYLAPMGALFYLVSGVALVLPTMEGTGLASVLADEVRPRRRLTIAPIKAHHPPDAK